MTMLGLDFKNVKFPVIIFFDDHHEPFQYYAEDLKEFYQVFLYVLENRLGSYFRDLGEPPKAPEDVLEKDVINSLPEPYKKDALQKYKNYMGNRAWYQEERNIYNKAVKAVKNKIGEDAYSCLRSHKNSGGDEGFRIVNIEDLRV